MALAIGYQHSEAILTFLDPVANEVPQRPWRGIFLGASGARAL
jgi:hypothetical protein